MLLQGAEAVARGTRAQMFRLHRERLLATESVLAEHRLRQPTVAMLAAMPEATLGFAIRRQIVLPSAAAQSSSVLKAVAAAWVRISLPKVVQAVSALPASVATQITAVQAAPC